MPRAPAPALCLALALAAAPAAGQGFRIDLALEDYLARTYELRPSLLEPGQISRLHTDFLCHRDGAILADTHAPFDVGEAFHWRIGAPPDGSLAAAGRHGRGPANLDTMLGELEAALMWQHCDDDRLTAAAAEGDFRPVASINDAANLFRLIETVR